MESLSSAPAPPVLPPIIATIGDENAPPSLESELPQGHHLSGKVLRPTRKTRQCFRDLTNNPPDTPRIRPRATPRKRKAPNVNVNARVKKPSARSVAGVKKVKLEMEAGVEDVVEQESSAPVLERISDFVMDEEEGQGRGPPILEKMCGREMTSSLNVDVDMAESCSAEKDDETSSRSPDEESSTGEPALAKRIDENPAKPTSPAVDSSPLSGTSTSGRISSLANDLHDLLLNTTIGAAAASATKKRKKTKGRNGNIYIGVANRIIWLKLQERFGFDNINNFGNFIMGYMNKVYEDFNILHQVAVDVGLFSEQGLTGFTWVNGLPHPVNDVGEFLRLPEVVMSDEYMKRAFEVTYDLCVKRGKFLIELASGSLESPEVEGEGEKPEETEVEAEAEVDVEDGDDHEVEVEVEDGPDEGSSSSGGPSQDQESGRTDKDQKTDSSGSGIGPDSQPEEGQIQDNPNSDPEEETPTSSPQEDPDHDSTDAVAVVPEATPEVGSSVPEVVPTPQNNPTLTQTPPLPEKIEEIQFQLEFQEEGESQAISIPISLDLNFNLTPPTSTPTPETPALENKENFAPILTTPTTTTTGNGNVTTDTEMDSVIAGMDKKKAALRQILGDISLEDICSPENFTPISTPK